MPKISNGPKDKGFLKKKGYKDDSNLNYYNKA
jgi:hypothetical protein